ncbi:uncharacterized protein [Blastocystis hominis]|uniref:Uncharacterized protein n=1 Tax=Blastocystis hominis TaxID=12968 RepID=D8M3B0_BLAHO|nr:uncharacterized protein [Blastocystis hominis]CBK22383.2 unnamed protein product [Blastocystis hominis]|eukprot:XP_012896431.1 uncharacterized protein [Blastocystis hominis]
MIIVLLVTAITSLLVLGVLIYTIRKYMGSTTVDETNEDTEALLKKEEKRGIGTNELSISETKTIVPILTKSEMEADTVVTMPMNKKEIELLSDEELLQDIGEDSEDDE